MKPFKPFFLLILIFFTISAAGQKKLELINSGKLIKDIIQLEEDGKYQEAASICDQVSRNDTNFTITLYGEAYDFYNLGKYDTAIRLSRQLTAMEDYTSADGFILLGNAYDAKKQHEEAIKVYKDALLRFPKSYLLYFNLGVAYYRAQRMDEAYDAFKKTLAINPFHPTTHYFLGLINAEEKRWAPAMLAMHTCLILGPNKTVESKCLAYLLNIAKGDYVPDTGAHVFSEPEDPAFAKIDKLIDSKMAFRTDYVIANKLDDKLMKQTQLLLETMMQSKPGSDNYFVNLYVPFYSGIMDNKLLKTFLYIPYQNVEDEIITKWKSKSKKDIQEFVDYASNYFVKLADEYTDTVDGKPRTLKRYFYNSHNIQALGDYADAKKEIPKGHWKIYFENTVLASEGSYDERGKQTGKWIGYYETGKPRTESVYKDGKPDGPFTEYYKNGNILVKTVYRNGLFDGNYKEYYKNGSLKKEENYQAGVLNGHGSYYYENGNIKVEGDYKSGNAEGKVTHYDMLGYKTGDESYKAGKEEGPVQEYHPNGAVKTKGQMVADHPEGKFQYFDENGKLVKEGEFQDGKLSGTWKEYNKNGHLTHETNYIKGKVEGLETEYDVDGIKYFEATFKDDNIVAYKYYDKSGKVLSEGSESHGEVNFKGYFPEGKVSMEGKMKKGSRDGKWTFYYLNGAVKAIENYVNGSETGPYKSFYKNGAVHLEGTMKNGDWDGIYRKYYQNGKVESEEIVANGKAQGDAYNYLSNGALASHLYYQDGDEFRWQSYYFPDGRLDYEYYSDLAHISKYLVYDTSGKVSCRFENPTGTAVFDVKYFNGKQMILAAYDKGRIDGEHKKFYGDGHIETISHYSRGVENGPFRRYFDNGKTAIDGAFRYDKRDSIWTYYNDKGSIESSGPVADGDYNGHWMWYYANGKAETAINFKDDFKDSLVVYFSPDGMMRMKLRYTEGIILGYTYQGKDGKDVPEIDLPDETGTVVAYYPNGNKSYEGAYKKGSRDGKHTYYYPDGKVQWVFNYIDGWMEGTQVYYYPDGKVEKEEEEMNDDLHGLCKYYDKDGTLKKEQNYYMGFLHGPSKVYEGSKVKESDYYYGVLLSEK